VGRLTHRTAPGCTYFVTTKTWQNRALLQSHESAAVVVERMLHYRQTGAYLLHEFVVMPNHLHLLITPAENHSLEQCMQLIKGGSSHALHKVSHNSMPLWQSGFHEETLRDVNDYRRKAMYIRMNPVHAHLAARMEDWPPGSGSGRFQLDAEPDKFRKAIPQGLKPT
jgi:putative transposase